MGNFITWKVIEWIVQTNNRTKQSPKRNQRLIPDNEGVLWLDVDGQELSRLNDFHERLVVVVWVLLVRLIFDLAHFSTKSKHNKKNKT